MDCSAKRGDNEFSIDQQRFRHDSDGDGNTERLVYVW